MLVSYHNCTVSYRGYYFIPYILGFIPPYAIMTLLQFHTDWEVFHTIEWYNFIPNRLDFIPNEVRFTLEMNLFIPKLNKSYHTNGQSHWTYVRPVHATQMAHTPTGKPELVSVVCENLYISLDKSRCLDVHDTGAPAPCNFLVLLPPPSTWHVGDPRVHKLTVLEISMTCVVNGVRHTSLGDALTRGNC